MTGERRHVCKRNKHLEKKTDPKPPCALLSYYLVSMIFEVFEASENQGQAIGSAASRRPWIRHALQAYPARS